MRILTILALFSVVWVMSCTLRKAAEVKHEVEKIHAVAPAPALTSNEQQLAAAKGEVERLTALVADEKLAPLRASLVWAEVILGLCLLVELGAAVFLAFQGMPRKLVGGLAAATACMLAGALSLQSALNHTGWIIAGVCVAVAGLGLWVWKHQGWLKQRGKLAWDAVPESTMLHPDIEKQLNRLFK